MFKQHSWHSFPLLLECQFLGKLVLDSGSLIPQGWCSLPGSSVHGILQARILEWVPCPPPGVLPDPEIEHVPASLAGKLFTPWPSGKPKAILGKRNANSPQRSSFPLSSWQLCTGLGHGSESAQKKSQVTLLLGYGGPHHFHDNPLSPSVSLVSSLLTCPLPPWSHVAVSQCDPLYLHGMPQLMGIIWGWGVHEADHDVLEVIGKLLLQVPNQVLCRESKYLHYTTSQVCRENGIIAESLLAGFPSPCPFT